MSYFQQWSFRHPSTADFFDVFEKVSGRDLSNYRRNLVEGLARLDWSVVSAKTESEPKDSGVFERAGGRVTYEKGRQVKLRKKRREGLARGKENVPRAKSLATGELAPSRGRGSSSRTGESSIASS
jgi:hypothetical protein